MQPFDFLRDLLVIYATAGAVVFVFQWLRLPAIVALLATGVVVGPYGVSLVSDLGRVELLADVGVVLLLFTVGMEFTRDRLAGMWHLLAGGMLQLTIMLVGGFAVIYWRADFLGQAVFAGFLVAHSSTAVLLKVFSDRGELAAPHARISLAVLVVQDLSVVAMIVFIPMLAGAEADWRQWLAMLLRGTAVVTAILLVARYLLPQVMFQVARLRSRELFMILMALVSMGTAWLTAQAGLSLALGAFLAGLALAESEYSHQVLADAIPFRDVFLSLFFVSIGMLFDAGFILRHPLELAALIAGVIVLKFFSGLVPALLLGYPVRVALLVGIGLTQIGEFAFVLSRPGRAAGLLPDEAYQALLAVAIVTMALAPFLLNAAPRWIEWAQRRPRLARWLGGRKGHNLPAPLEDHVIIVGYGVNGQNLCFALRQAAIPYVVLELNPLRFRRAQQAGEPVSFGDCTRPAVLERVGIRRARELVLAISDPESARRTVRLARQANPSLRIVVRTRYVSEVPQLRQLGADEVIPEEFETSIQIMARVLERFGIDHDTIRDVALRIRGGAEARE